MSHSITLYYTDVEKISRKSFFYLETVKLMETPTITIKKIVNTTKQGRRELIFQGEGRGAIVNSEK